MSQKQVILKIIIRSCNGTSRACFEKENNADYLCDAYGVI